MGEGTLKISQCMIVKNEEKNIQRALEWGNGIMWEQIVVDTGSTDRTIELAEAMGARVYHFEWIDDFSAAKNYAIGQASGDWIAFLDADEYLSEDCAGRLPARLEALDSEGYGAFCTPWLTLDDAGNITSVFKVCRLFKRSPGMLYHNTIHEELPLHKVRVMYENSEFPVYHTGYTAEAIKRQGKIERNIRLLKKELEKQPENHRLMGYLGDAYSNEDEDEAECWYRRAVELMPDDIPSGDERCLDTWIYLLRILAHKREEEELLKVYKQAVSRAPWVYDFDFILARYYIGKKEHGKATVCLERVLEVTERYGTSAYGIYLYANIKEFWDQLALCYFETGNLVACIRTSISLLQMDNWRITALTLLLKSLKGEEPERVFLFMQKLYNIRQAQDRMFLLKGTILSGAKEVFDILKKECTPEESEDLKKLESESGLFKNE